MCKLDIMYTCTPQVKSRVKYYSIALTKPRVLVAFTKPRVLVALTKPRVLITLTKPRVLVQSQMLIHISTYRTDR